MGTALIEPTRTRYKKSVKAPAELNNILGFGANNRKLGDIVTKGRFKGYKIYQLSLEERATCPRSCHHWFDCYGNNMPFAKRVDHTDPDFLGLLETELDRLASTRGGKGVMVRLHVLGDFYSEDYVDFWWRMLDKHANLAVWGYTARKPADPIGQVLAGMGSWFGDRCRIRESNAGLPSMSTVAIKAEAECPPNAFVCPEQTGKTKGCNTCGACWSTTKNVAFIDH